MSLEIRKVVSHTEEVRIEGGRPADPPLLLFGVVAVIANPWAGQGFVEDLLDTTYDQRWKYYVAIIGGAVVF